MGLGEVRDERIGLKKIKNKKKISTAAATWNVICPLFKFLFL